MTYERSRAGALLVVGGMLAVLIAVIPASPSAAAFPGSNGKIVFEAATFDGAVIGPSDLYVINADGTGRTRLTTRADSYLGDMQPQWSPDGQRIVFAAGRNQGVSEIYVMNADGTGQTQLTFNSDSRAPAWSPDGQQIAFQTFRDNNDPEIYVMDADGTDPVRLTDHPGWDDQPAWSPDGEQIVFSRQVGERLHLYVMDAEGGNATELAAPGSSASWSPDGQKLAFESDYSEISVADADGSSATYLASGYGPAWSPDGAKVAFGGAALDIYSVNPDGTGFTNITNSSELEFNPDWQPIVPMVSVGDVTVTEGTGGRSDATFAIRLSRASASTVFVDFTTLEGTALTPSDFASRAGTRTFLPGERRKLVTVPIVTDSRVEPDESFALRLLDPQGAFFADDEAIATIRNDDVPPPPTTPAISISDASVAEGGPGTAVGASFRLSLSSAASDTVTVQWSTANDSATAPSDYKAQPPTLLTFNPGVTARTVTVKVYGDGLLEGDELFLVNLASPTNATISDGQGIGTIRNDD